MRIPMAFWTRSHATVAILLLTATILSNNNVAAQDDVGAEDETPAEPKAINTCNGVFLTYTFMSREKEYPHLKNATAQAWSFKSTAEIINTGEVDLKLWKMFIGFQYNEILVSASGAVITDGSDFPVHVGKNGTHLSGFPMTDLKNAIETAGDMTQISVQIEITGTQFGLKPPTIPMPKTIRLENDGYKCPKATRKASQMYVCCVRDPKFKVKNTTTRFLPRQAGDLLIAYDVIQSFDGKYLAQVTLDNNSPLSRLDSWNMTWEWMRGEFIYSMRGAYTYNHDPSVCLYGTAGTFYKDFDFTTVASCEKKPLITDMPPQMINDTKLGKLPGCCRNGTLLPPNMDPSQANAMFQMEVFKIPPEMNRTALTPPQNWKIVGVLNPNYKCGPPFRVSPHEFPDPSGLASHTYAIASWQIVCNITRPKPKQSKCCVSFSAFYNESVVPCGTCACGCPDNPKSKCNPNAKPMLLPPEALLVPFENRTAKAKAWAKIKHLRVPRTMPCGDNCGVSINWHVFSDYRSGWTARITLFNWEGYTFKDWFAAVQIKKAFPGFEKVYSFNGTTPKEINGTIFMQGLEGLNYLMPIVDGKDPKSDPRVPGKQQSVISFSKKETKGINILAGDGFPTRVYFNGEECALPPFRPRKSSATTSSHHAFVLLLTVVISSAILVLDYIR